ncbi:hypothetical protein BYT27DRAFT_7104859 [Phlegmacium glaucopus]|nr:hypothetical protein BYT27DRAFT_7104859 [Phlegmacium glaucopus]
MKVQWSSTYLMLDRAEQKKTLVDTFINELHWEETNSSKRNKICVLKLDDDEWQSHADNAQQAFLSDQASTLHLAIPTLEALRRAWSSCSACPKYE